jgi:hypothetical protein
MAAGDTMQGRRLPDGAKWYGDDPDAAQPGDYGRVLQDGEWGWRCRTPNGYGGDLRNHNVIEHENRTITVSPSILVMSPPQASWHGYLERGVWREV